MKKACKLLYIFSFLLICLTLSFASQRVNSKKISYELLTNNEGLSQNSVSAIAQDKYGFLWIGTEEGVSRFDGHTFRNFKSNSFEKNSLSNPFVNTVFRDKRGNIWIGSDGGLDKLDFNTEDFINYSFVEGKNHEVGLNSVYDIIETYTGNFYLASVSLIKFDKNSGEYTKHFIQDSDNIVFNTLVEDNNGTIWAGTTKGLYKVENPKDSLTFVKIQKTGDANVNHLYLDKQGVLWVGTDSGLFEYSVLNDRFSEVELPFNEDINISYIFEDSDHCLWLSTHGNGLITSCDRKKTFNKFDFQELLGQNILLSYINTVYEDNSGVIWLGLDGAGIIKIEKHKNFQSITADLTNDNYLNSNRIFGLKKDLNENKIWISTYGGGINLYDRNTGLFKIINNKNHPDLPSNIIRDIHQLPFRENIFWISTDDGVTIYDKNKDKILNNFTTADGLNHTLIYSIVSDDEENIWIATAGGLNKYNYRSGVFESIVHNPADSNSLSSNACRYVYIDKNKNLWVGTEGKGLNRYNKSTKQFEKFLVHQDFPGGAPALITSIYEDVNNNFWVATYGNGLIKLNTNNGNFIRFTEEDGLSNNSIYGILEDGRGNLWISSNNGLSKFNIKDASFQNYYKEDGLQGNEFNDGAYCRLDNGEMYFGGFNGITYFDPMEIQHNRVVPQIAFTKFIKGNEEFRLPKNLNETEVINLSHKDYIISFEFVSLNFIRNEKNRYAYKLEGLTDDWIFINNKRSITFTSLDPGEYIFRIKGSNNDGLWNETGRSIRIIVHPPFYATIYFRAGLIALLIVLGVYLYRKRIKNVHHQKEKLRRIVAERTKELETANASLLVEIEERKKAEEDVTRYIEELQESKDMMERNAFDLVEINMKIEESEQKLKELNAQKDKFFSIISHDLKSPFVALLGYTDILVEEFNSLERDEMKEFITSINKASKNVYNLLENLLEWSRIQTGRIDFTPEFFNLCETGNVVIDLFEENAKRKEIKVENLINNDSLVFADENMVNTILRNLVSNALKFTKENGTVSIISEKGNGNITISVKDTGLGMSEETIAKLFRIDVHHTTIGTGKEKGTGVGLILCKELVEKNGGEIWVESKLNKGSEFKFTLPLKPVKTN